MRKTHEEVCLCATAASYEADSVIINFYVSFVVPVGLNPDR